MARERPPLPKTIPPTSVLALAIGRIAIGRLVIKKARFAVLEVDELTVRRLRVTETEESAS